MNTEELLSFEELFDLALLHDLVEPSEEDLLETDDLLALLNEHYSY